MESTKIIVRKVQDRENDAVRAIISLTVHTDLGAFAIHDIKIIKTREGRTIISMPNRKDFHGILHDIVHPIGEDARGNLEAAVYAAYERHTGRDIRV